MLAIEMVSEVGRYQGQEHRMASATERQTPERQPGENFLGEESNSS